MKKILLIDDHPIVRMTVIQMLRSRLPGGEYGEASNAREASKIIRLKDWDLIILDIEMPGRNGLEVLKDLKAEKSKAPVLVFSSYPEEHIAMRVLRAGASGYLSKGASEKQLTDAVAQILEGKKYFTPHFTQLLAEDISRTIQSPALPSDLLSDREYETLLLIAKGKTVKQIADDLSLSISTIYTLRERIRVKMDLKNNAELVKYVFQNQLTELARNL